MELLFWSVIILVSLIGIAAGILLSFYFLQERLIFRPEGLPEYYKYNFKIPFEENNITVSENVKLNTLLFKRKNSKGLIFYIHGNSDNLSYWGNRAEAFVKNGWDVFMYDFRGFGKSNGEIKNERMIQRDTKVLYHSIKEQYANKKIIIYGFSLGTGIAARLAKRQNPYHLILEAPYYNFLELIRHHRAYLPAGWISKYKFRTNQYLAEVKCDVFIFHGVADEKVPYFLGKKLKNVNSNSEFVGIENATHNNLVETKEYLEKLKEILR